MPELYQGKNTSVEINQKQDKLIKELEWENIGIAEVLTRSLKRAKKMEELREEKKKEIREIERKFDI